VIHPVPLLKLFRGRTYVKLIDSKPVGIRLCARIALALALCFVGAGTAEALPSLQLGPGSDGTWTYDTVTQTWVTPSSSFELVAFANATSADGGRGGYAWDAAGAGTQLAYLVVSAIPMVDYDGFDITIQNDGGTLAILDSGFGTPPLADPNDLAPHGIFDTWFEIYAIEFDGALTSIWDTQSQSGPSNNPAQGFAETFSISVDGLASGVDGVHFDLFTLTGDGTYSLAGGGIARDFAPFSHDAQAVPEPQSALLFGVGGLIASAALRRRR
jgi:hypothetical protein